MLAREKLLWPPSYSQLRQKTMYKLRDYIRGGISVSCEEVHRTCSKLSKSLQAEVLKAKDPHDGQNLLVYAASYGRKDWFLHVAKQLVSECGAEALVKELRELDINGAPLLFFAASSQTTETCFSEVFHVIRTFLGMGGLLEQFETHDHKGRNIMMYAARGKNDGIFQYVRALDKEVFISPQRHVEQCLSSQPGSGGIADGDDYWTCEAFCYSWGDCLKILGSRQNMPERAHGEPSRRTQGGQSEVERDINKEWFERVTKADFTGKTMLHHAAEAASSGVLKRVLELANEGGDGVQQRMTLPDKNGRTPIMLFMRNQYNSCDDNEDDLKAKMKLLLDKPRVGWMKPHPVVSIGDEKPSGKAKYIISGRTELVHAARGGLTMLNLLLDSISEHQMNVVVLDDALGMKIEENSGEIQTSPPEGSTRIEGLHQIPDSTSREELEERARNWGYGMLLASAVKSGHVEVIKRVVTAIKTGRFLPENGTRDDRRNSEAVVAAINAIKDSKRCLFMLAIMSGNPKAAQHVYREIIGVYYKNPSKVWELLSGPQDENGPLTFAASAPMTAEKNGVDMLRTVYHCLRKAARDYLGDEDGDARILELLRVRSRASFRSSSAISPLGAATLKGNWILFRLIYDLCETLQERRWTRDEVWNQLPKNAPRAFSFEENQEMHEIKQQEDASLRRGAEGLSSVMWHDIVQAYRRGKPRERGDRKKDLLSWRGYFKDYSRRAVSEANDSMFFDDLREMVKEGFPLHDEQIPELLENIEDHEHDVIDIIMFAIGNASNPLVMSAGVSKKVQIAETECPMHRSGLRRLQKMADEMADELLDKLPHTVRGVGLTLLRSIVPENRLSSTQQRRRDIIANLVGYIAVEWMLEPRLLVGRATDETNYDGPNYLDPLQRAVDRGSQALQFVNNPLVLDYLHWKFNCSLPHWASRKPDLDRVHDGFYTFRNFDSYKLSELSRGKPDPSTQRASWDTFLLRFLQGWNDTHVIAGESPDRGSNRSVPTVSHEKNGKKKKMLPDWRDFPRHTLLPGLQFLLAGIIGKPETFYEVPVVLFSFELLSYLTMLILFCSCVILKESNHIPRREWTFYFFVAGLIWRELLEFLDGMPVRQYRKGRKERQVILRTRKSLDRKENSDESQQSFRRSGGNKTGGKDLNRMVSALTRYIMHDTWNLLDISSIIFVVVAFIFRLRGLTRFGGPEEPGDDFFFAQFFLAWSAPLLFSRLLLLSQIDGTLGPMIQILWRLMSHTLRFSAFIIVVLTSFALAFHAVFITCDEDSGLFAKFGRFSSSLLAVFGAALGEFGEIAEDLEETDIQCPDSPAPERARYAGFFFLVTYLVVMAVVLLNLLIAVLSSEHQKVHSKGEMEFHMAKTRLIMQNSLAVTHRRIPAPFNLIQLGIGFLFDGIADCWWHCKKLETNVSGMFSSARFDTANGAPSSSDGHSQGDSRRGMNSRPPNPRPEGAPTNNSEQSPTSHQQESIQTGQQAKFIPATSTFEWFTFEGFLQRLTFALTMGLAAVALSALLWIISLPWVAWSLLSWFHRWDQPPGADEEGTQKNEHDGHFRIFFRAVFGMVIWSLALAFAVVLCMLCFIGSVVLWVRGLGGIVQWTSWRLTDGKPVPGGAELDCPMAMPGQQRGDHWKHAWEIVKAGNYSIRHENGSAHFHISPLLKRTTGFDMERLVMLIKQRDTKNTRDKEFKDMDKEATQALFSPQMQYRETRPSARSLIAGCPWPNIDSGVEEAKVSS